MQKGLVDYFDVLLCLDKMAKIARIERTRPTRSPL